MSGTSLSKIVGVEESDESKVINKLDEIFDRMGNIEQVLVKLVSER